MFESLRALMAGAIDYAGLFPPARLPLAEAWKKHLDYLESPHAWMLSRFVIPATKLPDLSKLLGYSVESDEPSDDGTGLVAPAPWPAHVRLTVLNQFSRDLEQWAAQWLQDCNAIARFQKRHHLMLDVFEVKLPAANQANLCMPHVDGGKCFLEISDAAQWRTELPAHLDAITAQVREHRPLALDLGYKLRTGGLEAAAFPSCVQVATTIIACRNSRVMWKATAGLHHPVRHLDSGLNTWMHGFLNLLFADVLAHVHRLDVSRVEAIISDEDPSHFHFVPEQIMWTGPGGPLAADKAEIAEVRQKSLQSFGCCSFDDPLDGLRKLGLSLES